MRTSVEGVGGFEFVCGRFFATERCKRRHGIGFGRRLTQDVLCLMRGFFWLLAFFFIIEVFQNRNRFLEENVTFITGTVFLCYFVYILRCLHC